MLPSSISETGFGVDISSRRADDVEKKLLREVALRPGATVLDLGCGAGGAAARLSAAGAVVTGVDQFDFSASFETQVPRGQFVQTDLKNLANCFSYQNFDYVLCQRTIHYLHYEEAKAVLASLAPHTDHFLYISFSGLESDLAVNYLALEKTVTERFAKFIPADQLKFGITEPICLYTKDEAAGLLEESGWHVREIWQSAFGNVKIIATPLL